MDSDVFIKTAQSFLVAGVDEAGRGPLAGPVAAAAVILDPLRPIDGLADSKLIGERKRDSLFEIIKVCSLSWSVGTASVEEIDELNILQATLLAMRRAVLGLAIQPDKVLIDGDQLPDLPVPARAIVKGDSKVKAISAASIVAKVVRDGIMNDYYKKYPDFSFHQHKGYGTKQHLAEIEQFGFLPVHRKTFNPVKTMIIRQNIK
ncbi:MAG: ribonuclease HII [Methylococcales bacterium]|nr:ribonuclease HII [Methylococcales bacterium]